MPTVRTREEFGGGPRRPCRDRRVPRGLGLLRGGIRIHAGFGFGWVPAIITGLVVAVLVQWLWIVAIVGIIGFGLLVLLSSLVGA